MFLSLCGMKNFTGKILHLYSKPYAMKFRIACFFLISLILSSCTSIDTETEFIAGDLGITLDNSGRISHLFDLNKEVDYLLPDSSSYLIQMRFNGKIIPPVSMQFEAAENMLYFKFPGEGEVKVKLKQHKDYLRFELYNISGNDKPDLLIWGPVYTSIGETIGETVGVVRNHDFAIGIQSLNPKTLGGYPWLENDVMPEMDYFDQGDYSDLKKGGIAHTLYRIEAARPVSGGSVLHAYCRMRDNVRSVPNWGFDNYIVQSFDDGGLIGSSVAIFGTQPGHVLHSISSIEIAEGLPHPELNGKWSKLAPEASSAYMIMGFGEEDFDRALDYCEQAGLKYLYHGGPFKSWGHFELNEIFFPDGRSSLKRCVDKAEKKGISIGLHTLSNFITTNDAYVTPIPDTRLAEVGYTILTKAISPSSKQIEVQDPSRFNQFKNNYLKAFRIGNEIIRYAAVSETAPWVLQDCQRGAFGTFPSRHGRSDTVFKLADHAYKVFLSNPELTLEIAENIAALYNETGVRQISFDGLEGCRSTGLGNYGEILFTSTWYKNLDENIRRHYIADASRSSHYFWHIFTRMNWGEPWYAGFRESQTEYRLKNQKYFDRNYIPNMLGWFLMKPETSIEDIEWLLARSAAFDAGYAFVTSYDALENNGFTDEILAVISRWESARMAGIFSQEQKKMMEDIKNEFTLGKSDDDGYQLTRIHTYRLSHEYRQRQPGEPVFSSLSFENTGQEQLLQFIITAKRGTIINPEMEIDGSKLLTIPVKLNEGEHLKFDGEFVRVYSARWQLLKSISIEKSLLMISSGIHHIDVSCNFKENKGEMSLELRLQGETILIN